MNSNCIPFAEYINLPVVTAMECWQFPDRGCPHDMSNPKEVQPAGEISVSARSAEHEGDTANQVHSEGSAPAT